MKKPMNLFAAALLFFVSATSAYASDNTILLNSSDGRPDSMDVLLKRRILGITQFVRTGERITQYVLSIQNFEAF